MEQNFSMKELYSFEIIANSSFNINDRIFEKDEVVASFDKIMISNFQEISRKVFAKGGYKNKVQVMWDDLQNIDISFTQGIFSKTQLALLASANLETIKESEIKIRKSEIVESDENGIIVMSDEPVGKTFIYDVSTGEKIYSGNITKEYNINQPYKTVRLDYHYNYTNGGSIMTVGKNLITGYLSAEGRTRTKDDITGQTKTAIIKFPKIKLVSDLSIRLGSGVNPVVGNFRATAFSPDEGGAPMNIIYLNDDIDADIQ